MTSMGLVTHAAAMQESPPPTNLRTWWCVPYVSMGLTITCFAREWSSSPSWWGEPEGVLIVVVVSLRFSCCCCDDICVDSSKKFSLSFPSSSKYTFLYRRIDFRSDLLSIAAYGNYLSSMEVSDSRRWWSQARSTFERPKQHNYNNVDSAARLSSRFVTKENPPGDFRSCFLTLIDFKSGFRSLI